MTRFQSFACATLLAASLPAFAQQSPAASPAPRAGNPSAPKAVNTVVNDEPDPAALRAMKSRVFVIQHRDPFRLQLSLERLGSGTRGAGMNWSKDEGFNTITVRDFPENLAAIEEALKRLDVPAAVQRTTDVELHLHVLFAAKGPVAEGGLPDELQEVLKSLRGTLAYRGYTLAASFVQRAQLQDDGRAETGGLGHVLASALGTPEGREAPRLKVEWRVEGLRLDGRQEGTVGFQMNAFRLDIEDEAASKSATLAKFRTPLSLKEGERVVVGTSVVKDHGIIVVLSARRVK